MATRYVVLSNDNLCRHQIIILLEVVNDAAPLCECAAVMLAAHVILAAG